MDVAQLIAGEAGNQERPKVVHVPRQNRQGQRVSARPVARRPGDFRQCDVQKDLAGRRVEDFYYLSRAALIKDERNLDKFDRVFGHVFKGLELLSEGVEASIPEEWLKKLAEKYLTEEEVRIGVVWLNLRRLLQETNCSIPLSLDRRGDSQIIVGEEFLRMRSQLNLELRCSVADLGHPIFE